MFRNTPFAGMPTYKLLLGFSLCSLGGVMLYSYFKSRDDDEADTIESQKSSTQQQQKKPEKEICRKMVIANDHIPLIVGRTGANLKAIEENTGTKIRLRDKDKSSKFCDINGLAEAVSAAQALILRDIERAPIVRDEIHVPQSVAVKLNGRAGEIIQEICRNSLAKVTVDPNGRSGRAKISIIGNQKQVNIARKLIQDRIEEDEELQRAVEEVEQKREPRRSPTSSVNSSMYSSQTSLSSHSLPPREKMLAARAHDKPMEVYVSAIATPSKFWLQLVGPQSKKLDDMVQEMTAYYSIAENRDRHVLKDPYVGQIVAGIFKYDCKWYRAEIVDIIPNQYNPNEVVLDLYFVDYGDSEYVSLEDIYELRTDFLTLRFQAVECFLANIKSTVAADPNTWQKHSTQKFEEITEVANWKKLIARVVTYKERPQPNPGTALNAAAREGTPIPGVELFDPTEGAEVNIGQLLISYGFALPLDDERTSSRSRSYTPTTNGESDNSTIEEICSLTPTSPCSPMNSSSEAEKNDVENLHAAEDTQFSQQLEHLQKQKNNLYVNGNHGKSPTITNPAVLSADFQNGNTDRKDEDVGSARNDDSKHTDLRQF